MASSGGEKLGFQPQSVGSPGRQTPVYWANDLFLRRALSLAAVMAESGRSPAPRTDRHGHSRTPLSAALRAEAPPDLPRFAIFFDSTAPASPRAPVHAQNSSER